MFWAADSYLLRGRFLRLARPMRAKRVVSAQCVAGDTNRRTNTQTQRFSFLPFLLPPEVGSEPVSTGPMYKPRGWWPNVGSTALSPNPVRVLFARPGQWQQTSPASSAIHLRCGEDPRARVKTETEQKNGSSVSLATIPKRRINERQREDGHEEAFARKRQWQGEQVRPRVRLARVHREERAEENRWTWESRTARCVSVGTNVIVLVKNASLSAGHESFMRVSLHFLPKLYLGWKWVGQNLNILLFSS